MKNILVLLMVIFLMSCDKMTKNHAKDEISSSVEIPVLNSSQASRLAELPLFCLDTEYPNKLNQTLGSENDLKSPKILHPAFYGCFDWHSAVHGHWSLVSLLKQFPDLKQKEVIIKKLKSNLSQAHVLAEVVYFEEPHNTTFERTYGWAWLLKLAAELHTWDNPLAQELESNLKPLTDLIIEKYKEFLPKLNYPIRVGEHTNTAFGLTFAHDYACLTNLRELKTLIEKRARDFYSSDESCPLNWEPSGFDFLSPCLEEAALMKRVLNKEEFAIWLKQFLPQLFDTNFTLETGKVSDRTDGKLVHLDGLNFSRAWCLNTIAKDFSELQHLNTIANKHINYSLPALADDSYEGGHWLASFAILALNTVE